MYANWKQLVGDPLMPNEWPKRARIGLNGFSQIARLLLRGSIEDNRGLDIVAINVTDLKPEQILYLIKYDTLNGQFKGHISNCISVNKLSNDEQTEYCVIEVAGREIGLFHYEDISQIPWNLLNVEYVLETTGKYKHLREVRKHLTGGRASKVLVIGDTIDIPLLMYPISCRGYQRGTSIVASGSAMAHAVATITSIVDGALPMEECMVTIILPVEANQNLVDGPIKQGLDWRKGRGALQSIIPGRCISVVQSVYQALPKLKNRLDAITMNVPTFNGAVIDLTCRLKEPISSINEVIEKITQNELLDKYNLLHNTTKLYKNQQKCSINDVPTNLSVSSLKLTNLLTNKIGQNSDLSESDSISSVTMTDKSAPIKLCDKIISTTYNSSIFIPLSKEDAYVSSDVLNKHTMSLLSVDCCISLPVGKIIKLISWFDLHMSFAERILDTLVFMRNIDHN